MATREQMIAEHEASPEYRSMRKAMEREHWHVIAHLGLGLGWHRGDYRETITRDGRQVAEIARREWPARMSTVHCVATECLQRIKE
jgi:histidinol phosphatase-like PHP family hydrolase